MELAKQGSSETSSEENNDRQKDDKATITTATATITATVTTATTTKRFYDCIFCKKGFDNAQALGGHMNIHGKAKSKAKQVTSSSLPNITSDEEYYLNPSYIASISSQRPRESYYLLVEARNNYHMYFQPSGSSPRQPYGNYYHCNNMDFLGARPQSLSMNDEKMWGSNLSLRVGSGHGQDNEVSRGVVKEDEVDLDLRLGHVDRY